MKTLKNAIILTIMTVTAISCGSKQEGGAAITNENYETNTAMTVSIEGMTCAMGCAKTIEKEVAGLSGVTFSEVDFESNEALFKYDANTVSEEEIVNTISGLAEGQYKPTVLKVEKVINAVEENAEDEEKVSV